ncbi:hypothetical protein GALMADRAFT_215392 [Galerina marginata CBS 339.88]|uniref:Uncharacterized protein n=1 Tax=Galerina marginata (strain CBS 339.88) TaxID=685588 RepID=A0A067SN30_GALM3|nr:hypothetical protein GALMADRAFT_215392 [Galerina marginata CBS 339.88]
MESSQVPHHSTIVTGTCTGYWDPPGGGADTNANSNPIKPRNIGQAFDGSQQRGLACFLREGFDNDLLGLGYISPGDHYFSSFKSGMSMYESYNKLPGPSEHILASKFLKDRSTVYKQVVCLDEGRKLVV